LRLTGGGGVTDDDRDRRLIAIGFSSKNIAGSIFSFSTSFISAYLQHFRT
jgi:hypothetical protein